MVYRQSALGTIAFDGRQTLQAGSYNDASSTKQNYTAEFVTIFSNGAMMAGEISRPGPTATVALPQPPSQPSGSVGATCISPGRK